MIRIICVGKVKERFYRDAIEEYFKRLTKYTKLEIVEVSDVDFDNKNIVLEREKENILKVLNDKDYIITLEIDGKQMTSIDFSKKIDNIFLNNSNIAFIIGGSYGLHKEIKGMSNYALSFSEFTFPHQLFRIILLEQIYRAFKIQKNESYHK
jgi:23S rRNA (pseudouridine1915-N3)-methyltransferase